MTRSNKFTSAASAAALLFTVTAPAAQAADRSDVFAQSGQAEPLAATEMQATKGRVAFMAAATGVLVFAAGASLGYTIGSDLAEN